MKTQLLTMLLSIFLTDAVAQSEAAPVGIPPIKTCLSTILETGIVPADTKIDFQYSTITKNSPTDLQITTKNAKFILDGKSCKNVDPTRTFNREIIYWMNRKVAQLSSLNDMKKDKKTVLREITRLTNSTDPKDKDKLEDMKEELADLDEDMKHVIVFKKWILECSQDSEPNQEIREAAAKLVLKVEAKARTK